MLLSNHVQSCLITAGASNPNGAAGLTGNSELSSDGPAAAMRTGGVHGGSNKGKRPTKKQKKARRKKEKQRTTWAVAVVVPLTRPSLPRLPVLLRRTQYNVHGTILRSLAYRLAANGESG